jgi:hypothetical protein
MEQRPLALYYTKSAEKSTQSGRFGAKGGKKETPCEKKRMVFLAQKEGFEPSRAV